MLSMLHPNVWLVSNPGMCSLYIWKCPGIWCWKWNYCCMLNSLWPSDAIWWQRSGSILTEVIMACCLTAPRHYLNQCWLRIRCSVVSASVQFHNSLFGNISSRRLYFKITATFPRGQWVEHRNTNYRNMRLVNVAIGRIRNVSGSKNWGNIFSFFCSFLAATKQLYEWFSPSVRPSVCLSVTPFSLWSHHRIIIKFSGVINNDRSDVRAKGQGQRSKVKVTEVTTQLNGFRTVTPVWIHIGWWIYAYSLILLRRGALLFFKRSSVKFQGHTVLKIIEFDPDWAFPDCNSSLNSPMALKRCTKLEVA